MKNAMQLKAAIKNMAKEKNISAQIGKQILCLRECLKESLCQNIKVILY